jgi:hypothetical protein
MSSGVRKLLWVTFWLAAAPVAIAVALLAMPLVLVLTLIDYVRLRASCWRRATWCFLVVSPRRGWRELIANNLATALPADIGLVWTSGPDAELGPIRLVLAAGFGQAKPYLAQVRLFGVRVSSLHNRLQTYKARSAIDLPTQAEMAALLREEVRRLRGDGARD